MALRGRWVLQMAGNRSFLLGLFGLIRLGLIRFFGAGLIVFVFVFAIGLVLIQLIEVELTEKIFED